MPRTRKMNGLSTAKTISIIILMIFYAGILSLSFWVLKDHSDWIPYALLKIVFFTFWWGLLLAAVVGAMSVHTFARGSVYTISTLMIINGVWGLVEYFKYGVLWIATIVVFSGVLAAMIAKDMSK